MDKYGPKWFAVVGMAYLVLPLVLLRIPQQGGTPEIAKFSTFVAMCGFGLAIIAALSIVEASFVVEQYCKHNKKFFGEDGPYAQLYAINSKSYALQGIFFLTPRCLWTP